MRENHCLRCAVLRSPSCTWLVRSLVQMWYVPSEEEVNNLMARFGDKTMVTSDEYVSALTGVHVRATLVSKAAA